MITASPAVLPLDLSVTSDRPRWRTQRSPVVTLLRSRRRRSVGTVWPLMRRAAAKPTNHGPVAERGTRGDEGTLA